METGTSRMMWPVFYWGKTELLDFPLYYERNLGCPEGTKNGCALRGLLLFKEQQIKWDIRLLVLILFEQDDLDHPIRRMLHTARIEGPLNDCACLIKFDLSV